MYGAPDLVFCYAGPFWYTKIAQWYTKIAQLVYKNCTKLIPKDSSGGAFGLTLPARIIFKKKVIGPKIFFFLNYKKCQNPLKTISLVLLDLNFYGESESVNQNIDLYKKH